MADDADESMNLEGPLACFAVSDVVLLLAQGGQTGSLRLRRREMPEAAIGFVEGFLCSAVTDVGRQSLGRRIVGAQLASLEQLSAAVGETPQGASLVPALVQHAGIGVEQLAAVAAELIIDELAEIISWDEGSFVFVTDDEDADAFGLRLAAKTMLREARGRRRARRDAVAMRLDRDAPLALSPVARPVTVSPGDWQLLALVDGRRSAGEIVVRCGRAAQGVGALAELVARGLLRVVAPEPDGTAAPAERTDDAERIEDLFGARERAGSALVVESAGPHTLGRRRLPTLAARDAGLLAEAEPDVEFQSPAGAPVSATMLGQLLAGIEGL